jgi:hypothetical protein
MKKSIQTKTVALVVFGALYLTAPVFAQNATVNWGLGPQTISSDSDVSTLGTLVDAFALGNSGISSTTVNGVTFVPFVFPDFSFSNPNTVTSGNYNFTEDEGGGLLVNYSGLGTGAGAYLALTPAYQTLLGNGGGSTAPTTLALTISGLTVGQTYLFQWWDNNSSQSSSFNGYELNTVGSAGDSVTLSGNPSDTTGDVGQFAIGTFIANDVTQVINFDGSSADGNTSDPMLNAFQLRVADVPEPTVYALFGLGALGCAIKIYSRKKAATSAIKN